MPKVPFLRKAANTCWGMRRKVPDHLRVVVGKREIVKSYGPVSFSDARKLHDAEMARMTVLFANAERKLSGGGCPVAATPETIARAAATVLHDLERPSRACPVR